MTDKPGYTRLIIALAAFQSAVINILTEDWLFPPLVTYVAAIMFALSILMWIEDWVKWRKTQRKRKQKRKREWM